MSHWGDSWVSEVFRYHSRLSCFHLIRITRGSLSFTMTQLHAKNSVDVQTFLLSTTVTFWVIILLHDCETVTNLPSLEISYILGLARI